MYSNMLVCFYVAFCPIFSFTQMIVVFAVGTPERVNVTERTFTVLSVSLSFPIPMAIPIKSSENCSIMTENRAKYQLKP